MTVIKNIFDYMCTLAPLDLQASFDNSGFLVGDCSREVNKVLLALDVTETVVDEAVKLGAGLIISHHPVIFSKLRTVTDHKLLKLIENRVSVISMHTNLDIAHGGVNDVLIEALGASSDDELEDGCGRVGFLREPMKFEDFLPMCKDILKTAGLRYISSGRNVYKLAVMGGSGGDSIEAAYKKGCDTYVTADIKYHQFQQAQELGLNLIDGDHFCTENPVIPVLAEKLSKEFPETEFVVSTMHRQLISFA